MITKLVITGQCPSGKNAVIVTRTGHRFPAARFKKWRDGAMLEIMKQNSVSISGPVHVELDYYASDRRRRDVPGIIDAVWHVLEKVGAVTDDTFLGGHGYDMIWHHHGIDRENPRIEITLMIGEFHASYVQV